MTTTVIDKKIGEAGGKDQMLVVYKLLLLLIKKTSNKTPDHAKYITTTEFNKFDGLIFNTKIKTSNFGNKS